MPADMKIAKKRDEKENFIASSTIRLGFVFPIEWLEARREESRIRTHIKRINSATWHRFLHHEASDVALLVIGALFIVDSPFGRILILSTQLLLVSAFLVQAHDAVNVVERCRSVRKKNRHRKLRN